MDRMLHLMADLEVSATCFVLGWIAERLPGLVRRIADAGHEIASHGYRHELVYDLSPAEFRTDVQQSKYLLEDIVERDVLGYRAPSFSVTNWAFPILEELGFRYDSSFFPTTIAHDRYGRLEGANAAGDLANNGGHLAEVSLPCLTLGRQALPWAGGGYFRLIPYPLFRLGVKKILGSGKPYVFYIHPWEIDAGQPRLHGLKRSERVRHYLNLEKTESRWQSLLRDFRWAPISELLQ
jgi:polysaccharide deacetylase family protein (PEP-CTERM system associated)